MEILKTIAISGYFDPLHAGHIEYINTAKCYADVLIVIVNNDVQCRLKKGGSFMNEWDRCFIMSHIVGVDNVVLSVDKDNSVCKTLEIVKPNMFANGGDQYFNVSPERKICEKLGIRMIDGLGKKIRSSSKLLENWVNDMM